MKTMSYHDMPEFPEIHRIVSDFFGDDRTKIDTWFTTPNPMLGNMEPAVMLVLGKGDRLLRIVRNLREGNVA